MKLRTGERKKGEDFVGVRVRQWDLGTGRETAAAVIRVYDGDQPKRRRQAGVRPRTDFVALSPDLKMQAAAGPDNTVRVWDAVAALRPVPANPDQNPRR